MACKKCNNCEDNGCAPTVYPDCILTKVPYPCLGLGAGKTGTQLFAAINAAICAIAAPITVEGCIIDAGTPDELEAVVVTATATGYKVCLGQGLIDDLETIIESVIAQSLEINSLEACVYDASGNCPADEAWRNVGAVGEPAYIAGASAAAAGISLSFRLNKDGKLAIRGGVLTTPGLVDGDVIFTLPVGYRPNAITVVIGGTYVAGTFAQVSIAPNGQVAMLVTGVAALDTLRLPEYIISLD